MSEKHILKETKEFVKNKLYGEGSGHDWWHIERVCKMAIYLAEKEKANLFIVEMAALLHDIDDWKFSNGNDEDLTVTEEFLNALQVEQDTKQEILSIIRTLSYKGGVVDSYQQTIEGKVVQDADRLDAIGAIGVARTFAYGGHKNRQMYDPNVKPHQFTSLEQVKSEENHTINHFYEKLLKLKDLMNTKSAKEIAEERHAFMKHFLHQFYKEWNFQ